MINEINSRIGIDKSLLNLYENNENIFKEKMNSDEIIFESYISNYKSLMKLKEKIEKQKINTTTKKKIITTLQNNINKFIEHINNGSLPIDSLPIETILLKCQVHHKEKDLKSRKRKRTTSMDDANIMIKDVYTPDQPISNNKSIQALSIDYNIKCSRKRAKLSNPIKVDVTENIKDLQDEFNLYKEEINDIFVILKYFEEKNGILKYILKIILAESNDENKKLIYYKLLHDLDDYLVDQCYNDFNDTDKEETKNNILEVYLFIYYYYSLLMVN